MTTETGKIFRFERPLASFHAIIEFEREQKPQQRYLVSCWASRQKFFNAPRCTLLPSIFEFVAPLLQLSAVDIRRRGNVTNRRTVRARFRRIIGRH